MSEKVLCIVAHPDDETLGCGATIAKHVAAGDQVSVLVLADGVSSRASAGLSGFAAAKNERHGQCRTACKILGTEDVWLYQFADNMMDNVPLLQVVQHVEKHLERFSPTLVYTHHSGDFNVDHRVTHEAVNVACRPQPGSTVKQLYYFEVPCSTTWAGNFRPTRFVDVTATLEQKLGAATCYASELREYPHPRSLEGIRNIALVRGASVGMPFAEAFEVGRIST